MIHKPTDPLPRCLGSEVLLVEASRTPKFCQISGLKVSQECVDSRFYIKIDAYKHIDNTQLLYVYLFVYYNTKVYMYV